MAKMISMGKFLLAPFKKEGLLFLFMLSFLSGSAQFWTEDFGFDFSGTCVSQATEAPGVDTGNGPWAVTNLVNDGFSNVWYISSSELGGFAPCGAQCIASPFDSNQTLHIGQKNNTDGVLFDSGATYSDYNFGTNTNTRVESPPIDFTGQFEVDLEFRYAAGNNVFDKAFVVYSLNNGPWIDLEELPETGVCGPGSISWVDHTVALPLAANSAANVRIGFRWENNANGIREALSVAIDDIELHAGPPPAVPVADFEVVDGNTQFCEGLCASFTDLTVFDDPYSTGAGAATYAWTFDNGVDPVLTADVQEPTVCFPTPGFYEVTLTVTDNIGPSTPAIQSNLIDVQDCGPVIMIDASQTVACANEECIDFTDLSTGNGTHTWLWTFTSASGGNVITSNLQNPTNICLNEIGFYDVTLLAVDLDGSEEQTFPNYIEVIDCTGPEIDFTVQIDEFCAGRCIQLTDESTSSTNITAWEWTIPGGYVEGEANPGMSTQQNPLVCYDSPGTYNITLSATDAEGPSGITKTLSVQVIDCSTVPLEVNISVSADTICAGDCVDFTDWSLGEPDTYLWFFEGPVEVDDIVRDGQHPAVVCYDTALGSPFNVTLTITNDDGQSSSEVFVDYITVKNCTNPPVPRIEISMDTICAGKCVDYTSVSTGVGPSAWEWNFQGAVDGSQISNLENPSNICYDETGTYAVSLMVSGAGGDSSIVFEDVITIVSTPECRPSIEPMIPDTLCAGDCASFNAIITDADSVRWTFDGGNPAFSYAVNPGTVCFDEMGDHFVTIEAWNASGAAQPIVETVFAGERPDLNAGPDFTINAGAVVELTADVGGMEFPLGDFLWQPFDYVDDFRAQTVETAPDETTQYIVSYSEPGTCTAIDSVMILVNFKAAIGVPSAFSPNGDGNNDELRVLGQGIAKMDFKVFNRYGQLVFKTTNQSEGWDGRKNEKDLNPGTFVYTLEVSFAEGGREVYTGNVTLVR